MREYAIDLAGITEGQRVTLVNLLQRKGEVIMNDSFVLKRIKGSLEYQYLVYCIPTNDWCGDNYLPSRSEVISLTSFLQQFNIKFKEL